MRETLQIAGGIVLGVLTLDAIAFGLWVVSGQYPVDGMYAGALTAHLLRAVLGL